MALLPIKDLNGDYKTGMRVERKGSDETMMFLGTTRATYGGLSDDLVILYRSGGPSEDPRNASAFDVMTREVFEERYEYEG